MLGDKKPPRPQDSPVPLQRQGDTREQSPLEKALKVLDDIQMTTTTDLIPLVEEYVSIPIPTAKLDPQTSKRIKDKQVREPLSYHVCRFA